MLFKELTWVASLEGTNCVRLHVFCKYANDRFLDEELSLILKLILDCKKCIDMNHWKRILNVCLQNGMQLSPEVQELSLAAALKCRNFTFCRETISDLEMSGRSVDPRIRELVSREFRKNEQPREFENVDLDDVYDGKAKTDADHLISLIGRSIKNGRYQMLC